MSAHQGSPAVPYQGVINIHPKIEPDTVHHLLQLVGEEPRALSDLQGCVDRLAQVQAAKQSLARVPAARAASGAGGARRHAAGRPGVSGPVSVSELQAAWHAVQAGQFRTPTPRSIDTRTVATAGQCSWQPPDPVYPVIGAHRGAGSTLVALAIATAHGEPAHLVECAPTVGSGLVAAGTAELGTVGPWSRGTRGHVVLDRLITAHEVLPTPEPPPGETTLTVLDVARDLTHLIEGHDWAAEQVRSADVVALTAAATVPGMRQLEAAILWLGPNRVRVAVIGPPVRRWPRPVARAAGPLTRALLDQGEVVAVPHLKALAVGGISCCGTTRRRHHSRRPPAGPDHPYDPVLKGNLMSIATLAATFADLPAAGAAQATTWMTTTENQSSAEAAAPLPMVCPIAPPGAQVHVDTIMGYVLWGVGVLIALGVFTSLGAFIGGRVFSMPHASKAGIVGMIVVLVGIIGYFVLPPIVETMMGTGCV